MSRLGAKLNRFFSRETFPRAQYIGLFYLASFFFFVAFFAAIHALAWLGGENANDRTVLNYLISNMGTFFVTYLMGSFGALARVSFDERSIGNSELREPPQKIYGRLGSSAMFGALSYLVLELGLLDLLIGDVQLQNANQETLARIPPSPGGIILVAFVLGIFTSEIFSGALARFNDGDDTADPRLRIERRPDGGDE